MHQNYAFRRQFWLGLVLLSNLGELTSVAGGEVLSNSQIADRVEQFTFASKAFTSNKSACIVLPSNYSAQQADWPVLYLLHGRGRSDRSLIDDASTREALLSAPFATVLPNGEDGWYFDSPVNGQAKYATLLEETISTAEAQYRLSHDPKRRAIAGWSMGGYGAVSFAEGHPTEFAVVGSIIGLLDFPRNDLPPGQTHSIPIKTFGKSPAIWDKLNPINAIERLRGSSVLLVAADRAFDRTMNENFRQALRELKIEHEWVMLEGGHDFAVVKQALSLVIKHVESRFAASTSAAAR